MSLLAAVHERGARVWRACTEAAAADGAAWSAWIDEKIEGRRLDTRRVLELIFGIAIDPVALEIVMTLYSAETYLFLTERSGWSRAQYEEHVLDATLAIIRLRHSEL